MKKFQLTKEMMTEIANGGEVTVLEAKKGFEGSVCIVNGEIHLFYVCLN